MSENRFLRQFSGLLAIACLSIAILSSCTKEPVGPVPDGRVEISSISLSQNTAEMIVGESASLVATVLPPNATDRDKLIWSSSKQSVATVSDKGLVQAVSEGESTIMVSAGGKSASCKVTVSAKVVHVSGVSLNPSKLELEEGGTAFITATVSPEDATDQTLKWSSDDPGVAKVTDDGRVMAVSPGSATVSAVSTDGNKTATCVVTVSPKVVPVSGVVLSPETLELVEGQKGSINASVSPEDATDKTVVWSSSDEEVVAVGEDGTVTALSAGEATVTATTSDGGKTATCKVIVLPKTIPVSEVTISSGTLELVAGETGSLTVAISPEDATDKSVVWSSSDEGVATVTEDGTVTAVSAGEATITATTSDGGKTVSCTVTVTPDTVSVTGVTVSPESLEMVIGETEGLTAAVEPEDATDKTVTWSSSDEKVATVGEDGTVKAVSAGNATITVTTGDGGRTATCEVKVNTKAVPVTGISVFPGTVTLEQGKRRNLTAVVYPADATNRSVTWTSSDNSVVTVSYSGIITAVSAGKATVTATTKDGSFTASCVVTVTAPAASFSGLTLEAINPGTVTIDSDPMNLTIEYSKDGVNWTAETANQIYIDLEAGEKVYLRGDNETYCKVSGDMIYFTNIICSSPFYAYGNVMSLIDSRNFGSLKSFTVERALYGLFKGSTNLRSHPSKDLVLPATKLTDLCYRIMFEGCTGITRAPALPSTKLAERCYQSMFSGCSSLVNAPVLPATDLANLCYNNMFAGCTSLASAPALRATQLTNGCYYAMFSGCTSLIAAPSLPATKLAEKCYGGMFNGCTSLTSAPMLHAEELAYECYNGMFRGCTSLRSTAIMSARKAAKKSCYGMYSHCTSLTSASSLPATELADSCYAAMFHSCTSLKTAPALPATKMADHCYYVMFYDCSSLAATPSLPATALASYCYASMFNGCSSLTVAKDLPASELADGCYSNMFRRCTSLKATPALPATELAPLCYIWMFAGCTSLTEARELPAAVLVRACYQNMFNGCTSLMTGPKIYAKSWGNASAVEMFFGCSSLNSLTVLYPPLDQAPISSWLSGAPDYGTFYYRSYDNPDNLFVNCQLPIFWETVQI